MKHVLFCAAALVLLFSTACTKKDLESNYWIIGGSKVIALNVARVPTTRPYLLSINGSNNFSCYFSDFPTESGTYKIVTSDSLPHSGEMAVVVVNNGLAYGSTGHAEVNAAVTIKSGKISITLPNTWVASKSDSLQVSAMVAEF